MKKRTARIARKTAETDISLSVTIEGTGAYEVHTGIPFLDHMLSLMCKHGLLDADLRARGDLDVDDHHTVEDVGIVLGQALKKAAGDMRGIRRYGAATVPMDEAIAAVSLDVSGRPYLVYNVSYPKRSKIKDFDVDLVQDFLHAFVSHAGVTLHVNVPYGRNTHHMVEAVFKALGRALREALEKDPRSTSIPSTKGII
jgi:imidazoleglycerol-phosphate dehydratase